MLVFFQFVEMLKLIERDIAPSLSCYPESDNSMKRRSAHVTQSRPQQHLCSCPMDLPSALRSTCH